jgi:regulator of replication initiation timing
MIEQTKSTKELIEELIDLSLEYSALYGFPDKIFDQVLDIRQELVKRTSEVEELKKQLDWYKNYADRLVEHKDMVCLPADLKNLRESNLKLATENEELKKKVETLKGVITQAWFTDVEEKDKQIEYLLQKVKELSDPELKDDTDYIY